MSDGTAPTPVARDVEQDMTEDPSLSSADGDWDAEAELEQAFETAWDELQEDIMVGELEKELEALWKELQKKGLDKVSPGKSEVADIQSLIASRCTDGESATSLLLMFKVCLELSGGLPEVEGECDPDSDGCAEASASGEHETASSSPSLKSTKADEASFPIPARADADTASLRTEN
ncbi:uncharacterized protein THITE_155387 [Thermothielavioides terrestris NRRL 8126]|uniref:Uncharacterized protein n=1 Tax=Thermothielavioides terrestris (strain ATCC 38088 / NRRL 8126) TaxID=578455 RepID=G2R9P6_THETT|nr:uncharacterized protein THITE_155387 [Thermothielavioides terrestris NRRL 8126]AEO68734.1 hypothetical protein THITE_155387 [Thermothielavioides terrestris NRRL 8126]